MTHKPGLGTREAKSHLHPHEKPSILPEMIGRTRVHLLEEVAGLILQQPPLLYNVVKQLPRLCTRHPWSGPVSL